MRVSLPPWNSITFCYAQLYKQGSMRTHGSRASEKITNSDYKNLNYSGASNDALLKKPAFWRGLQLVFLFFSAVRRGTWCLLYMWSLSSRFSVLFVILEAFRVNAIQIIHDCFCRNYNSSTTFFANPFPAVSTWVSLSLRYIQRRLDQGVKWLCCHCWIPVYSNSLEEI